MYGLRSTWLLRTELSKVVPSYPQWLPTAILRGTEGGCGGLGPVDGNLGTKYIRVYVYLRTPYVFGASLDG